LLIDGENCVVFAAFLCFQTHHDKPIKKLSTSLIGFIKMMKNIIADAFD